MNTNIAKLSWFQQFLFFGIMWTFLGILLISFLFIYSGFNLSSISQSAIAVTINTSTILVILGILNFGIATILKLKKVEN